MVNCFICCRQVNECSSGNHAILVAILDVLSEVHEWLVNDFPCRKPACSLIRCDSTVGDSV